MTESQLGAVSALGAGLLVGTALAVVLPEGFGALHAVHESAGAGRSKSATTLSPVALQVGLLVGTALHLVVPEGVLTRCMQRASQQAYSLLC